MTCVKQRNEKSIIINFDLPTIFLLAEIGRAHV